MKALIWKELRENLHWAALPVLVLAVVTVIAGPPPASEFLTADWLLVASLLSGGCAAALGFLQICFEARGDKRSLLLHRPISRSRIFLAKAIIGLTLYLLALGLPLVWSLLWVATPGHFAGPFRFGMALPWLADVLAGVVYYFAGMLAAQREARWYGSRGLSLVAAFGCTIVVWAVPEFWQALVVIAFMGTLLGLAAWGSFLAGGTYTPQPRLAKFALAGTFMAGLFILNVFVKFAVGAWLAPNSSTGYYTLDRQGRALLVRTEDQKPPVVTDLEGNELPELKARSLDRSALREIEAPMSESGSPRSDSYRNRARYSLPYTNSTTSGEERWYYLPDEGRLVGYENESKRFLGSIGPDGFAPPGAAAQKRFDGELLSYPSFLFDAGAPAYLSFPNGVYTVNFPRRTIRAIFVPPPRETVLWTSRLREEKEKKSLVIVGTGKSVQVIDESAGLVFSAPLIYDQETYGAVRVGRLENPQRFVVEYEPSWYLRANASQIPHSYLVEYEVDNASDRKWGREIARRTTPFRKPARPARREALFGMVTSPIEEAVLLGGPRFLLTAARAHGGKQIQPLTLLLAVPAQYFIPGAGLEAAPADRVQQIFTAISILSAAICSLLCFLLTRRHAFSLSSCIGWAFCGLAFGWIGVLLLLTLHDWPARVRCASCGRERRVDRDRCEHCDAPHAAPISDGTEIFETTTECDDVFHLLAYQSSTSDAEDRP